MELAECRQGECVELANALSTSGDVAAGGVPIEQALDDWVDCESLQGGIRKRQAAVDFDSKLHKPSTSEVWVERIDKSKKRVEKTKGLTSSKWR